MCYEKSTERYLGRYSLFSQVGYSITLHAFKVLFRMSELDLDDAIASILADSDEGMFDVFYFVFVLLQVTEWSSVEPHYLVYTYLLTNLDVI